MLGMMHGSTQEHNLDQGLVMAAVHRERETEKWERQRVDLEDDAFITSKRIDDI